MKDNMYQGQETPQYTAVLFNTDIACQRTTDSQRNLKDYKEILTEILHTWWDVRSHEYVDGNEGWPISNTAGIIGMRKT